MPKKGEIPHSDTVPITDSLSLNFRSRTATFRGRTKPVTNMQIRVLAVLDENPKSRKNVAEHISHRHAIKHDLPLNILHFTPGHVGVVINQIRKLFGQDSIESKGQKGYKIGK